ncbi:helix-turn-helix domain-containing protein [Deminuibacter soli]|uniref:AraC family transcriptional regulator n=1 Tax=Deminuibacter soli TaxID=2291815 RepID=A0A3E1NEI1_9BACT|nr:helix-turn-helix domain-containing protein [Deminuibacter soli]RFM26178.1 AraC family transcriptional regulator [Deminuibacter soli]
MKIQKFEPSQLLKPFVNSFMIVESDTETVNRILPGTSLVMAFRFRGTTFSDNSPHAPLPAFCLTGISTSSRLIRYTCNTGVLLVHFREGAAAAFFNAPLHETAGYSTPLDQLLPAWQIQKIEEQLSEAPTHDQRIRLVEELLNTNLKYRATYDLVTEAVKLIKSTSGNFKISELVKLLNTNVNSFEKQFRSQVGTGPKHFSSIIRLRSAIQNYKNGADLTKLSYAAGFFDQSHFIKGFKTFTGESPSHFFKQGFYW